MSNKKVETGLTAKVIKDMERFGKFWQQSLDLRVKAAKLYFKAANEDLNVKYAFQRMPQFAHWSPAQWRVVFYVGAGSISTKYLDVHPYTISLSMLDRNVCLEDQDKIFEEGLQVVVGNSLKTIPVKNLTAPFINQAFDKDGTYRTEEQQKEYIKQNKADKGKKEFGKLEQVANGKWKARTSCVIDKELVRALLLGDSPLFSVDELEEIIEELQSRGDA